MPTHDRPVVAQTDKREPSVVIDSLLLVSLATFIGQELEDWHVMSTVRDEFEVMFKFTLILQASRIEAV